MTEKSGELEHLHSPEVEQPEAELAEKQPEKHEKQEKQVDVNEVRHNIEHIPQSEKVDPDKALGKSTAEDSLPPPSKGLQKVALNNQLNKIRDNLSKPSATFSKFVHNPSISAISEIAGKTLARPYGILMGGIFALFGSSIYLYVIRHTGYKYNYFVSLLLFVGGFAVAIIVEIVYRLLFMKKKKKA